MNLECPLQMGETPTFSKWYDNSGTNTEIRTSMSGVVFVVADDPNPSMAKHAWTDIVAVNV